MLNNLRYSIRQLAKTPGFAAVAIVTIALGIGANTAVFSIMNAVLLRLLPVPNPEQLVLFHLRNQPLSTSQSGYTDDESLSLPVFQAMRRRRDVFTDVVAFAPLGFGKIPVRFGSQPEQARGELVSGNFFSGLGVKPFLGRSFTPQDEINNSPVAVISDRWWRSRFTRSPDVLGQTLYVKGVPISIVGVAGAGFEGADPGQPEMDFWIPLQKNPILSPWGSRPGDVTLYGSPNFLCLMMIGRLKSDVSAETASAALTPLFRRALAEASPVSPNDRKPELMFSDIRGIETLREDYQKPLRVLMTMVGVVLLIASANVAMLMLLRNTKRRREFALRRALGANARMLFGQLISESLLLVSAGCLLAWFFASQATEMLTSWSGLAFPIALDHQVLLFTITVSTLVAIAFGLIPMRAVSSLPLAETLKASAATANTDRRRFLGRKLVVTLQISLCTVLLFVGQLLYGTLRNLETSDLGMRAAGILVFGVTPQTDVRTDAEAVRFHLRILNRLRDLPEVDHATVSAVRLGTGASNNDGVLVDGRNPLPAEPIAPMGVNLVGSDFLHTLGIPLHLGRDFNQADVLGSNRTAIINQTFADRYLPHTNPLGHQIALFDRPKDTYAIVGVSGNSRYTGVKELDRPVAYLPFSHAAGISAMQYEIHSMGEPRLIFPGGAKIVHGIDPYLPLEDPITQREQFEHSISQERLIARLSIAFAGLAMFLVLIGLYGTVSYSVNRRTIEIGLRLALGACHREVLGMVLRESALLALLGIGIGLPIAYALARTLRSMLFGLSAADPIACIAALTGIAVVTLAATLLPALRAASIDPMSALRTE
jgi:predicted permease